MVSYRPGVMNDVIEHVKKGLEGGCQNMLMFTDKPAERVNAEYLFTVNIAQSFGNMLYSDGDPYRIYLEKSRDDFSKDCVPALLEGDARIRRVSVMRGELERPIKGRIDIVVYDNRTIKGYYGLIPVCAIEVKGFNPPKALVLCDLKRNLEYFYVRANTGESAIEFTLFVAIEYSTECDVVGAASRRKDIKEKYEKYVEVLCIGNDVNSVLDVFDVSHDPDGRVYDYEDYVPVINTSDRHHYIGVVVCFFRN